MTAYPILLAVLLGGCLGADVGPTGAGASTVESPTPVALPAQSLQNDDMLTAAQRKACSDLLVSAPDTPLLVVGRASLDEGELLRVAWADSFGGERRTQPTTQTLFLSGDTCVDPLRAQTPESWTALRSLHASPAVNDRIAALEVQTEGGVGAAQAEIDASRGTSFAIRECWPFERFAEALCTRPELAAAYRRVGLEIEGPKAPTPQMAADISSVPDSLRGCIPATFRDETGEIVLLGAVDKGPQQFLAFERFDGTPRGAAYNTHVAGARQDPTGECTDIDPQDSDVRSAATVRLLQRPEIARRSAAEHVARAGGVDAYLEFVRNDDDPQAPYRCGPNQIPADHHCLPSTESEALEAVGVPVHAPRSR